IAEIAALPPAFACVFDASFDVRFIPWGSHTRRVQEQTTRLAVLQKRTRWPRVQRVGSSNCGWKIIENKTYGQRAEEAPRLLQAFDRRLDGLLDQRPHERVAAVDQDDHQPVHDPTLSRY